MAGHVQLKFVMTECSKTQIRLTGLSLMFSIAIVISVIAANILRPAYATVQSDQSLQSLIGS